MIVARIDTDAGTAEIETPEGVTTIALAERVANRSTYVITAPDGQTTKAGRFTEAVEYLVSRSIRSAAAIAKIRKAS